MLALGLHELLAASVAKLELQNKLLNNASDY